MKIILSLLVGGIMCSCSQNMLLDKQGKEDLMVCSGACVVSSSIRKDAAKFCASQIFWGTYGGLFGEGWEIKVKVSDGFSDETYHLVSFINEDDETFDFKEIV